MYKRLIFVVFSFLIFTCSLYSLEIEQGNKIIVKFRSNSSVYQKWLLNKKTGGIEELRFLLGENTTKPFISDALLFGLANKDSRNFFFNSIIPDYHRLEDNLSRMCVVQYTGKIDALLASRKLAGNPEIEYAEPMPEHHIFFFPNDPRTKEQYYLRKIHAFEAWDTFSTNDTLIVGIVDTGVDYLHLDLADNIWLNPGENGLDSQGRDRRTNGVDDDNDGYIDDWHGWDFASSDSSGQDNNPKPGHKHGTHVAGTIGAVINNGLGIAGIAKNVKILPVKVGTDDPNATSIENGFQGILYAAMMGAKVINCSWGSSTKSNAEQEIINKAVSLGSVIVAAAGNDGQNEVFYPAGYRGVMSVAAVDSNDRRAWFSNYSTTVDVSAPGEEIYATLPNNEYNFLDGTSMASPVAAGICALVRLKFPNLIPIQVIEHVKATTDNIDSINSSRIGLIGKGRVNALNAMTMNYAKATILKDYKIFEADNDGAFDIGETIYITPTIQNVLSPVKNLKIQAVAKSTISISFIQNLVKIGDMQTLEEKSVDSAFSFVVQKNIPLNYTFQVEVTISDDTTVISRDYISLTLNPSYRTMNQNNISVTVNSIGNYAYNDYPDNLQGDGFLYKNSPNLLFEGALMIGVSPDRVSNVARNNRGSSKDMSFDPISVFRLKKPGDIAALEGSGLFQDNNGANDAGVSVIQKIYQFDDLDRKDFIITTYDIINQSGTDFDSLYTGLFFDWDIGPSGSDDLADFDIDNGFGFMKNTKDNKLPFVGVKMLSSCGLNYFAIDNDGNSADNPGVYDGYSIGEKWRTMSSGIARKKSSITDASMVIAAGPIRLKSGDTVRVAYSIFAGNDFQSLINSANKSKETAKEFKLADAYLKIIPASLYPNPVMDNTTSITIQLPEHNNENITLNLYNTIGRKQIDTYRPYVVQEQKFVTLQVDILSPGFYFVSCQSSKRITNYPFIVVR